MKGNSHKAILWRMQAGLCWICMAPMDKAAKSPTDPMAPSIDHIVPVSRGGSNALRNKLLAHCKCNSDRGNAPVTIHGFTQQTHGARRIRREAIRRLNPMAVSL